MKEVWKREHDISLLKRKPSVQDCKIKLVWNIEALSSSRKHICCCRSLIEDDRPSGGVSKPARMRFSRVCRCLGEHKW